MDPKQRLLVIDDDDLVIQSIKMSVSKSWHVTGVNAPHEIPEGPFLAVFVDMHLTGNMDHAEGPGVIETLRKKDPRVEIIAISGNLDRDLMERCLKSGASRFLAKPLNPEEINLTLEKIEALWLLQNATQRSKGSLTPWVGQSEASDKVRKQIALLKAEPGPILIEGESGTGKEVAAHLINAQEGREPFLRVNIAAIPENLFESELFGHVRGAFTGADQNKMGLAEAAHGGDLFLDEIEALTLPLQVKLLRFLETGEVRRVGSQESVTVQTRVLIATNRNLENMVEKGEFREDLLWRINGKKILLPPLRERGKDLVTLSQFFLSKDPYRKKELTEDAIATMESYNWPGNVRELKRVCEQLVLSAPLPILRREDLLSIIHPANGLSSATGEIDFSVGLPALMESYEALVIAQCLEKIDDVDEVAKVLRISRSSLYKKIKDHQIEWRT
ncbi:MAG: sigma-54-dependent Fis family transcriptional regulator [Bdellovibrionales bacterium]|nr:sigma-54-dependent Fis family transcriptional regulator [Bdellovibrionales bacterium]